MSNSINSANAQFAADVRDCVAALNAALPGLAERYEELVMLAALAEHVGGALKIFLDGRYCSPEEARHVLRRLETTAFPPTVTVAQTPAAKH